MTTTTRWMDCAPQAVFDVLTDGWTYATWVVGAARIRSVDEGFPAPGTRIHHSVGAWPLLLSDETEVERLDAPRELVLRAKAWPAGEARVRITCEPQGTGTLVTMEEGGVAGPASLLPSHLEALVLRPRNVETLKRLAYLAESGARSAG